MRAERRGKIGPTPFRGHVGAGDDGVVDERLSAGTLPGVALHYFEHAAGPVGCGDVVRDVLLISQHDAAARDTEKVHARLGHLSQRLNHAGTRFAQGGEPAQAGGQGLGINRHSLSDSRAWRATALWRLPRSSCSIMVYAQGRVEPRSLRTSLVGCCSSTRAPIRRAPSVICISITLSIRPLLDDSATVHLDGGLSDVAYLDMAFWETRTSSDQAHPG